MVSEWEKNKAKDRKPDCQNEKGEKVKERKIARQKGSAGDIERRGGGTPRVCVGSREGKADQVNGDPSEVVSARVSYSSNLPATPEAAPPQAQN